MTLTPGVFNLPTHSFKSNSTMIRLFIYKIDKGIILLKGTVHLFG